MTSTFLCASSRIEPAHYDSKERKKVSKSHHLTSTLTSSFLCASTRIGIAHHDKRERKKASKAGHLTGILTSAFDILFAAEKSASSSKAQTFNKKFFLHFIPPSSHLQKNDLKHSIKQAPSADTAQSLNFTSFTYKNTDL